MSAALAERCAARVARELHERCGVELDKDAVAVVHDAIADELVRPAAPAWAVAAYRRGLEPDPED